VSPFSLIKSVREQNIPVADWGNRVDPGINQARMRPMNHIAENQPASSSLWEEMTRAPSRVVPSYAVDTMPNADEDFAKWIQEIGTPDSETSFDLTISEFETDPGLTSTSATVPTEEPTPMTNIRQPLVGLAKDMPGDSFISVNSDEHRLDTAYFHLRSLDLPLDASWSHITARYHEIMVELNTGLQALPEQADRINRTKRMVNIAYACLRLLAGK